MNLYPIEDCRKKAEPMIRAGWTVRQQFNCAHCGAKQTMSEDNVFYTRGKCEECGGETDIKRDGCNWMAMKSRKDAVL